MAETSPFVQTAQAYATSRHEATNHLYDGGPYYTHLQMVVNTAFKFLYVIPPKDRSTVLAACWCHDVIEDCRETYNDVKFIIGEEAADIVYALTNEKGKNRDERANDVYYKGINETEYAPFVKMCDRIANVKYSKQSKSSMFEKYKRENPEFIKKLGDNVPDPVLDELNNLFND